VRLTPIRFLARVGIVSYNGLAQEDRGTGVGGGL